MHIDEIELGLDRIVGDAGELGVDAVGQFDALVAGHAARWRPDWPTFTPDGNVTVVSVSVLSLWQAMQVMTVPIGAG